MKRILWRLGALALVLAIGYHVAGAADVQRFTKSGTQIYALDDSGNLTILKNIVNGQKSTAVTTTATSGNSSGVQYNLNVGGTTALVEGNVVVATNSVSSNATVMVAPATSNLTTVVGIAGSAGAVASVTPVYTSGFVLALTTGTVNPGDVLVTTSATSGYLWANNSPTAGTQVGVAMEAGTAAGGLTKIRIVK